MVALLCGVYIVGIVAYLGLRLFVGDSFWWLALLNAFVIYTFFPLLVLMPLALLMGLWRDFIRLGLVGLLAVVWFGPFFQPVNAPTAGDGTQLTMITFNMMQDENEEPTAAFDWLETVEADLVLLQEVPTTYRDGIPQLEDVLPEQVLVDGGRRLVLSRYPLEQMPDDRVLITVDGQQIMLFNVHLAWPFITEGGRGGITPDDVPYLGLLLNYEESERNTQLRALLDQVEAETLPVIVAGDLNMSQHSLIYSELALLLEDAFRETSGGLGHTWPSHTPLLRLDYVWYSDGLQALSTNIGDDIGSDHLPLAVTLEVIPTRETEAGTDE